MSRVGSFGQISEINDHLFLSGAHVLKPEKIRQKGITCIVNATVEEPSLYLTGMDYLKIRIDDSPYARLDAYFDLVADKIKGTKEKNGKTLVHCVAGVSRSASLVCAYLIKYECMSLRQAYQYVKSARPIIRPNVGFWKQLIDYEKRIRGVNTVQMVPARYGGIGDDVPDVYMEEIRSIRPLLSSSSALSNNSSLNSSSSSAYRSSNDTTMTDKDNRSNRLAARLANFSLTNNDHLSPSSVITSRSTQSSPLSSRLSSRYYKRGGGGSSSGFGPGSGSGFARLLATSAPSAIPANTHHPTPSALKANKKGNFFSSLYNSTNDFMFPTF